MVLAATARAKLKFIPMMLRRGKIFVEYEPQTRIEGIFSSWMPTTRHGILARCLTGSASGRDSAEQVTVFDSVGFAMEDFSMLRYLYKTALELNLGEDISLVPTMDDPKNLYSMLANGQRCIFNKASCLMYFGNLHQSRSGHSRGFKLLVCRLISALLGGELMAAPRRCELQALVSSWQTLGYQLAVEKDIPVPTMESCSEDQSNALQSRDSPSLYRLGESRLAMHWQW